MRRLILLVFIIASVFFCSCAHSIQDNYKASLTDISDTASFEALPASTVDALDPSSIVYLGAFRLPEDWKTEREMFSYGGEAMAYCEEHSSLYVTGHNWYTYVAEISIPEPVISGSIEELNRAELHQPLTDIRNSLFDRWVLEIPRVGLEVVDEELFFCWGAHYQEDQQFGTHGVTGLDLANPTADTVCLIGDNNNYATNDYMFRIPSEWADEYAKGCDLATGRFRDGGWSGMGPSLFAVCSEDIRSADMDAAVDALALIRYDDSYNGDEGAKLSGYSHADSWTGGAWIVSDSGTAVVFAGTHGYGETWYGFANGVVYPTEGAENEVYPDVPNWPYDQRGWWNDDFRACLLFYDPAHLAQVASGDIPANEIQPYACIDISNYLLRAHEETEMQHIGGIAYDPTGNRLFIQELFADQDMPIVHVFSIK